MLSVGVQMPLFCNNVTICCLQQKVKDWEQYEAEKTTLVQYLKQAEADLAAPPDTLAQETAQKEFQSKKVTLTVYCILLLNRLLNEINLIKF